LDQNKHDTGAVAFYSGSYRLWMRWKTRVLMTRESFLSFEDHSCVGMLCPRAFPGFTR